MKSKWLFTSLFFLAFCMSAYGIQVSAPDLEAQPGDAITIEVSVDDATGIAGADFSLVYDPAILAATDARLTELGTGLIPSDPNLTVAGQVTMAIMGLQGIAEGSGAFIEVDFDVLPDASGVSPLDLSGIALYDEMGEDLPVEVVNGSITVAGVVPSPEEANKAFISEYLQALSGKEKPAEVVDQYISDEDQALKQHIAMFEAGFPLYELIAEDMIAEGDKVAVRGTFHGVHKGEFAGVPATDVEATVTINITYRIAEGKIVEHWMEADQMSLMRQLGVVPDGLESYEWGTSSDVVGDPGDPEANKALVLSIIDVWNQQDLDMVDELVSPDFVNHNPVSGPPEVGIDAYKQSIVAYTTAFPDLLITVDDMVAEGDKVAKRWTATGTHQGELSGIPPLGTAVTFTGITIYRFADGKLVENWWAWDTLGLMQQITPPAVPETEANKAIERRVFEEIWNQGNLDLADELMAPDVVVRTPPNPDTVGVEAFKAMVAMYRTSFPDVQWAIEDMMAEGDMVVTRLTGTGTHQADFMGIPATSAQVTATMISIVRIADSKIQESWNFGDMLGLMQQLGVADPMGRESYVWGPPSEVVGDPGDPEANKVMLERYVEEAWNQQNLDVLDEIMSPDMVNHEATLGLLVGIEAHKQGIGAYLIAFPDFNCVIDDIIAEGDKVVTRWTCTGTHQGELVGIPPSGKQATWTGSTIDRIADGKIVEMWWAWDALGLMQQITPKEPEPTLPEIILASLAVSDAAVNSQDSDLLVSIAVDDYVYDYVPTPPPIEGKEAVKEFFTGVFQTFPDLTVTLIRPPLVAGDIAVVEHIMTGTHLGELDLGPAGVVPATGNSFQTMHMDIAEFEEGKLKKGTTYDDMSSQLMQLGILPAAELPELVPSFTPPDAEPMGFSPLEAAAELDARWNDHDLSSYAKLIHPDANIMVAALGVPLDRDAYIALQEIYLMAFPDIHEEIVRVVDMGNGWVMLESIFTGTNSGPYFGIPATGLPVTLRAGIVQRFDDNGLMTDMAAYFDNLTIMAQLGLLAPPPVEVVETGSVSADTWLKITRSPEYTPEQRLDGLYLVVTTPIEAEGDFVFTFDATGNQVTFKATLRGEFQELKVNFNENGEPVSATGPGRGSAELIDSNGNVAFHGTYMLNQKLLLASDFTPMGANPIGYAACTGVGAYADHHIWLAVEGSMTPNPENPEEIGYAMSGRGELTKQVIFAKPPTGPHTSEAWYRRLQDPGIVPEQRADGLYLVSTRQTITSVEGIYTFDTGEEITTKSIAWGERQEFKVIFDENGVPVKAVGCIYGLTMKGSDSYGNITESVVHLEYEISLSPDMQITGLAGEGKALTQLTGKFANYINVDHVNITLEPDPEDPTQMVYHAVGSGEMTEATGFSSVGIHSMQLQAGLNMLSVPLKPLEDYTARSLAEELGATVVIRYDKETNSFVGFTLEMPGDGYAIEAGVGYIVNVLKPMEVEFMGTIWGNVSLPEIEAAPPLRTSAWAFVVSGSVLDGEGMSAEDGGYMLTAKNLRTGATAIERVDTSGYFAAIWADLSRKAVAEAGDKVEVAVIDSRGKVVSGPFVHDITLDGIRNAVVKVQLRLGDIIPEKSALLQNYPNPFNPETWIPFHLNDGASVSIRIFNLSGQLIKTLDLGHIDAGVYVSRTKAAYWDGKNEAGEDVSSGIYFYSITAGDFSATKKMIIRK